VKLACLALAVLAIAAGARANSINGTDPAGDVVIFPVVPTAGPLADTADLTTITLTVEGGTLVAVIGVADMTALVYNDVDVAADIMFIAEFEVGGGSWDVRADYIAANGVTGAAWTFQLRPGGLWDGAVDVEGSVDESQGTVTMRTPLSLIWEGTQDAELALTGGTIQLGTSAEVDFVDFLDQAPETTLLLPAGSSAPTTDDTKTPDADPASTGNGTRAPAVKKDAPAATPALVVLAIVALVGWRRR
jgi:hypothetical protein